jgi:hypothetical protein
MAGLPISNCYIESIEQKNQKSAHTVLSLDEDDPEALEAASSVIAERMRDSDLDRDQRYAEAIAMARKATQTVDTDISVPARHTAG